MSDNTTTRPDDTSCAYTYTVKRGDKSYLIARRLGVPLRDLMNADPDIHPARLMVGDELCIPSCADHEAQEPVTLPDKVPVTDTPETPAEPEQPTTPSTPETPGESGGETGGETGGDTGGETTPPSIEPSEPEVVTCPENRRAVVQEGQTVADLQLEYDRSFHTLEAANPTLDLDDLKAGQTVCVPPVNLPCALPASVVLGEGETLESLSVRFNLPVATLLRANPCLAPDDFAQGVTVKLPQ
ncbi:MAG: LysM domain-containing protein [Christensenellales bacterium]